MTGLACWMQLLKLERMYLQVVVWDGLEPPHCSVLGVSRRYDEHSSAQKKAFISSLWASATAVTISLQPT